MRRFRHRARLRAPAFAAVVLLYLQALLPTLAAVGAGDRGDWIAVCSASGVRFIQIADGDGTTEPDEALHASVLCPMCLSVQIGVAAGGTGRVEPVVFAPAATVAFSVRHPAPRQIGEHGPPLGARAPPIA